MRITIRHGGVLKCDAEVPKTPAQLADMSMVPRGLVIRCPEQFTSYAVVSLVRAQAQAIGWGRVWAWQVTGDMAATARIRQDVCPEHNAIAQVNGQRRDEIVAAQREQAKKTKADERAQKAAGKLAERAQAANARDEKKAAKQKAKADQKAAREAEKAEAVAKAARAKKYRDELLADKAKKKAERAAAKPATVPASAPKPAAAPSEMPS